MKVASRMGRLGTETAFEVLAVVNRLVASGKNIISFAIGEPDFDTPENIKKAAWAALQAGKTHYGPSAGLPELRKAVADYVAETRSIPVDPEEVVIMPGAKPFLFHGMLACVEEGDEVIYPNPGFPIYESMISFVGARPVPAPLLEEKGFSFDVSHLEKLITPRTKMIILNSPQNPTGGMVDRADLERVAELAIGHDLWVMSDEVYSRITYESPFTSIASFPWMKERTILIDGFSKTYAMTGWRLGCAVMNRELAVHLARLETNCESCTATFTQLAGVEALLGTQDEPIRMVAEFQVRRDAIVDGLNSIRGIRCLKPKGAFYVFPNVTGACRALGLANSKAFQEYLLHEAGIAVLPRTSFGRSNDGEDQEYVRLSYATSKESIVEGLRRMKGAVER